MCYKMSQGQPISSFMKKKVELDPKKLHTKFQGNWPRGSKENSFLVCTIYGHGGHLVM